MGAIINANIFTPAGRQAVHGAAMGALQHIASGQVEWDDAGIITYVGPSRPLPPGTDAIDARGRAVLPGFVDSHTHLIFAGTRAEEFMWRMQGRSYMHIMQHGGGIASTMRATRQATVEALYSQAIGYVMSMARMGVTTVEAKTGYGLDRDTEMKQLRAIEMLQQKAPITVIATFLGAHAVPPDYEGNTDGYIDFLTRTMLPLASHRAQFCDVFCEKGVFSIEQSRRLLQEAALLGFGIKIHADEIVHTGGAELAAAIGATSADHLLHISPAGIEALAKSSTVATLLPLTAFVLREPYAPARAMIDAGCAVALASDFNPGSCFSYSVPLMIALACIQMRMSVEEAITALTLNGAAALGLAAVTGSLEPGKRADIVMLDTPDINMLPYHTGINLVAATIARGTPL